MEANNTPEYNDYEAAVLVIRAATREYNQATFAYRSHQIGDAAYLTARAKYKAADAAFETAFANVHNS